jgi:hypothetical protein
VKIMLGGEKSREATKANSRAILKQPNAQANHGYVAALNKGGYRQKSHKSFFVGKLIKP